MTLCPQCNGKTTPRHGGPHYDGERYCHKCETVVEPAESIEHVQSSGWAVIGARLERAIKDGHQFSLLCCGVFSEAEVWFGKAGYAPRKRMAPSLLEALTAAIDAAEGRNEHSGTGLPLRILQSHRRHR